MSKGVASLLPSSGPDDIAAAVDGCFRQILPRRLARRPLTPETGLFSELALDSMQVLQLISLLEDAAGRTISEIDLKATAVETIGDVRTLVARVLSR